MPRCQNIQFDREAGNVLIVGDDAAVYFPVERIRLALLKLSARELARLIGADLRTNGTECTGVKERDEPEPVGAAESDPPVGASMVTPAELLSAVQAEGARRRAPVRAILDRYGVAVDRMLNADTGKVELWVYPVTRSGAVSPIGTRVTQPTKPFLDEVNRVLGTSFYVAQFLPPVDDGMPF
jgi:hypothetical protein